MITHPKRITQKYMIAIQIVICLLLLGLAIFMSLPAKAQSTTLDIARVSAPDINCIFDQDCTITVSDSSDEIILSNSTGSGFLQSRTFPQGEDGTAAEGQYAYLYRIDLRNITSTSQVPCVFSMRVNFGPIVPVDYDGDEELDDLFIVIAGGLGTVVPNRATQVGDVVTMFFNEGVCGEGPIEFSVAESSVFIGLTSRRPNRPTMAQLLGNDQQLINVDARTPMLQCERILSPEELTNASLITFDDLPNAATIGDSYVQEFGVRFEDSATNRAIINGDEPDDASSPPNTVSNSAIFPNTSDDVPLLIGFDNPQTHVGFYIGNGDGDAVTGILTAFNAENKPICTLAYPFVPNAHTMFAGIHNPDGQIVRVLLDYGGTLRSESIDDLYIVAAPQPDLVIESVHVNSIISQTISYSYTVKNSGDAAIDLAGSPLTGIDDVVIQAFLSRDEVVEISTDFSVGAARLQPVVLEPGATVSQQVTTTAETDPFTYPFIVFMVDAAEVAAESNEQNNSFAVAIEQPDLIVEALTIDSISVDKIAYSYVIKNIGEAPINLAGPTDSLTDDVSVQAYLSQDEIFNNGGDSPAGGRILGADILAPTETFSGTFSATPQAGVDPATFAFLTLMVDSGEAIAESNERNNTIATPVEVGQPDLIVESLTVTEVLSNSIAYSYTIKNIGDAPVDLAGATDLPGDNVAVQAFLSQDMIFNNDGDSAAGGTIVGGGILAPGETLSGQFGATTQAGADPATFAFLTLMVDWGEAVVESNERNNTFAAPIAGPNQLRVCREENNECVGVPDALLYRVTTGGVMSGTIPLDENGYAIDPDPLDVGESFWAMQEISQTGPLADVGTARLYLTSGVTSTEVLPDTFANDIVLNLYISDQNPLMVRDLVVSAQWTPTEDAEYQAKLTENLRKTSNFFHDFTDGQFALGNITVYQNYDEWEEADVWLHADNNQRPLAVVGGMVEEITVDISPTIPLTYASGQVYMGSEWNRYYEPPGDIDIPEGANTEDDWALALGHELSHYYLFLWDAYFGIKTLPTDTTTITETIVVEPITTCIGTAMGYLYEQENTEFIYDQDHWDTACVETFAYEQTQGRTEWEIINAWYPWTVPATMVMSDTPPPPIDLTTISFVAPTTPTVTLLDQTFDLLYDDEEDASDRARAYIIRDDRIIEQGQPAEESSEMQLTGAAEGDRFCLFDIKNVVPSEELLVNEGEDVVDADTSLRHQFGCKLIDAAGAEENELDLEKDISWEPVIYIDFIESQLVNLRVQMPVTGTVANTLTLQAKFYPEHISGGTQSAPFGYDPVSESYSTTVALPNFTPSLYLQLWATDDDGDASETDPRREAIVGSGVKGSVVPGPARFGGSAPIISPKNDFIIIFNEAITLGVGQFIAIQETYAIPPLPTNTTPLNNISGYRLTALPGSLITDGSVSLRYLPSLPSGQINAVGMAEELPVLSIYYWDGEQWSELDTTVSAEEDGHILANAPLEAGGIYALLENVVPDFGPVTYLPFVANE